MVMYVAQCRVVVVAVLFLATAVVRMMFCNGVSSLLFRNRETVTLAKILQTLLFPGSAAFHRLMEDFRLLAAVYTLLQAILTLHLYVRL